MRSILDVPDSPLMRSESRGIRKSEPAMFTLQGRLEPGFYGSKVGCVDDVLEGYVVPVESSPIGARGIACCAVVCFIGNVLSISETLSIVPGVRAVSGSSIVFSLITIESVSVSSIVVSVRNKASVSIPSSVVSTVLHDFVSVVVSVVSTPASAIAIGPIPAHSCNLLKLL